MSELFLYKNNRKDYSIKYLGSFKEKVDLGSG